jgi:hypothetical protein
MPNPDVLALAYRPIGRARQSHHHKRHALPAVGLAVGKGDEIPFVADVPQSQRPLRDHHGAVSQHTLNPLQIAGRLWVPRGDWQRDRRRRQGSPRRGRCGGFRRGARRQCFSDWRFSGRHGRRRIGRRGGRGLGLRDGCGRGGRRAGGQCQRQKESHPYRFVNQSVLVHFTLLVKYDKLPMYRVGRPTLVRCHFLPNKIPNVPTIKGNFSAFGIKPDSLVLANSTLSIPQPLIVANSSSIGPYTCFHRNRS